MQQAYKPAMAISPGQNLLIQAGHTAVIWSPEKLGLHNKYVGIQTVEARHFVLLRDQGQGIKDESETVFQSEASQPRAMVVHTKTAHACALEILIQHGGRGVVVLDAFTDVPAAKIEAFEQKLIALGWFTTPLLTDLTSILDQVEPSDAMEAQVIKDLKVAVESAVAYRMSKMDDSINEIQGRKNGHMGRSALTREETAYYAEIGVVLPDSVTSAPISQTADLEEAESRLDRKFEALVGAMTNAFNSKIDAVVAEKIGASNEKDNEGTKETKARRSPLSS